MKKFLSVLLAVAMILALAACGKKEETTEAPTEAPNTTAAPQTTEAPTEKPTEKETETTPAPTLPPETTQAPTEPEPTTPEATTPEVTEPEPTTPEATEPEPTTPEATEPPATEPVSRLDPDATAEEVFKAMGDNLLEVAKAIRNLEAEPVQLSFSGSGSMKLTLSLDYSGMKMEIPLELKGQADGILDSEKGIHLMAEYSENLSTIMLSLMGEETEPSGDKIELYIDKETSRRYQMTESEGQWYYTDTEESGSEEVEMTTEGFTLEAVFESYTFTNDGEHYIFEGPMKSDLIDTAGGSSLSSSLPFEELIINLRLLADDQMRLCGFVIFANETELDLSEQVMEGFTGKLEVLQVAVDVAYEEVAYILPDEVRDNAVETVPYDPEDDTHPWADNVFVTDNEVLADNENYTFKAVKIEDDYFGPVVTFSFENKTDKKLSLEFDALSVNGYICDMFVYESVDPKGSIEFTEDIDEDDLMRIGVKSIDEIKIRLIVNDNEEYEELAAETVVFYPTGLTAEEIVYPERKTGENEYTIFENDKYKVIVIENHYDDFFGFMALTYIENNSEEAIRFELEDIKINGIDYETLAREDVAGGFKGYFEAGFAISSINVEKVEKLEGKLLLKDPDDFWGDPMESVDFSYEP